MIFTAAASSDDSLANHKSQTEFKKDLKCKQKQTAMMCKCQKAAFYSQ